MTRQRKYSQYTKTESRGETLEKVLSRLNKFLEGCTVKNQEPGIRKRDIGCLTMFLTTMGLMVLSKRPLFVLFQAQKHVPWDIELIGHRRLEEGAGRCGRQSRKRGKRRSYLT